MEEAVTFQHETERPARFPFWSFGDVLIYLGMAIPCFVLAFYCVAFIAKLLAGGGQPRGVQVMIPQFAGYAAAAVPLALLVRVRYDRTLRELFQWRLAKRNILPAVNAGLIVALANAMLGVLLRVPQVRTPMDELLGDNVSIAIAAVLGVTLAPLFEEGFFRGLLQPLMVRSLGVVAGIVTPAVLFGLLHGPQYGWSWRHVLLIAFAGSAFGWMRHRTQSVATAALMHSMYNLLLFVGFLVGRGLEDG